MNYSKIIITLLLGLVLWLFTRNVWLEFGRLVPFFGVTETIIVVIFVMLVCGNKIGVDD